MKALVLLFVFSSSAFALLPGWPVDKSWKPQQLSIDPAPSHTVHWLTNGIMAAGPAPTTGDINSETIRFNSQQAIVYVGQFLSTIDEALPDNWRMHPEVFLPGLARMIALEDQQGWINPCADPLPAILASYIALHPNATKEEGLRAFSYLKAVSWPVRTPSS